jgi:hypothetical protein
VIDMSKFGGKSALDMMKEAPSPTYKIEQSLGDQGP